MDVWSASLPFLKSIVLLAVLGLHCCMQALPSGGEPGHSSLQRGASHCSGFPCSRAWALGLLGFCSCRKWASVVVASGLSGTGSIVVALRLRWGFHGGSDGKESVCSVGDRSLIPGSGRSPGEENGTANPLQCSRLQNPTEEPGRL